MLEAHLVNSPGSSEAEESATLITAHAAHTS